MAIDPSAAVSYDLQATLLGWFKDILGTLDVRPAQMALSITRRIYVHRGTRRSPTFLRALFVIVAFGGFLATTAAVDAEDPCPPDAPRHASAVIGHTWSGTVVDATSVGAPKLDVEPWVIRFDVDRVYADRPEPDVPTLPIDTSQPFDLPSNTCGRPGDMGLQVGHRYLVSTSSFGDGTAIGSIVAWEIVGDRLQLVSGMYKAPVVGPQFAAVTSLDEALALVAPGVAAQSETPSTRPTEASTPLSTGIQDGQEASTSTNSVAIAGVVLIALLAGGSMLLVRRRSRDS